MDRRNFLSLAGLTIISPRSLYKGKTRNFGWIENVGRSTFSLFDISDLKNYGQNKVACLWKAYTAVRQQSWIPHKQVGGDCVAHASGSSLDFLTCCRIILESKKEKYVADSLIIAIYAGGRNLIASRKGRVGMMGSWAIDYLKKYGNLLRIEYPPFDLRPYNSGALAYWDRVGIPKSLQAEAKKHPLIKSVHVNSWEEVRDAVSSGYPVVFCASLGANNDRRDDDGFIKPKGRWAHAWLIAGIQDGRRPGACLINSHGASFGKGPKAYGQPDGSVWIDAKYIDYYIKRYNDSYALTDYRGFTAPKREYVIW